MLGIGAFVAGWVTWGCFVNLSDDRQWRVPLGIQNVPAVVLAALILLFPESPRWLIDHDRIEEGLQTLAKLHANGDINDPWVRAEFDQIQVQPNTFSFQWPRLTILKQETIKHEHEHEAKSYIELFTNRYETFRKFASLINVLTHILSDPLSAASSSHARSRRRFK
jgi:hypothetical protein